MHVHGRICFQDDDKFVRGVVARLTRIHEASQPAPWKMSDAPKDYIENLLNMIVGVEIDITRLEGKSKLGQDEVIRDVRGAGNALIERGKYEVGAAMLAHIDGKPD